MNELVTDRVNEPTVPGGPAAHGDRVGAWRLANAPAPDFRLADQHGRKQTLASLAEGRFLLLAFYPFAFSGVCTGEMQAIRDDLGAFVNDRSRVAAICCDSVFALRGWDDRDALFFPLLSDFWPHGAVAQQYGVFDAAGGYAMRSAFVIDPSGTVRASQHAVLGEARNWSGYPDLLDRLAQ